MDLFLGITNLLVLAGLFVVTVYYARQTKNLVQEQKIARRDDTELLIYINDPGESEWGKDCTSSEFYDRVISQYFGEGGDFKGTIYRPFEYEAGIVGMDEDELNKDENREALIQKNLYDFMRRLLVKRFESSFGAFRQSIDNFKRITEIVQQFITSSGGKYILDRKLIDQIYQDEEDEIAEELDKFEQMLTSGNYPKHYKVYKLNEKEFKQRDQFLADI